MSETARTSVYHIEEAPEGFTIHHADGRRVVVGRHQDGYSITGYSCNGLHSLSINEVEHIDYMGLIEGVVTALTYYWERPSPYRKQENDSRLRKWVVKQTRSALHHRVIAQWQRINPEMGDLHQRILKRIFSVYYRRPLPRGIDRRLAWLVAHADVGEEVAHYRAAAVVAGMDASYRFDHPEMLANWRGQFSPSGHQYAALTATLEAMPAGIPGSLALRLREVHLPRVITNRLELLFLLCFVKAATPDWGSWATQVRAPEIKQAAAIIAPTAWETINLRRTAGVDTLTGILWDFIYTTGTPPFKRVGVKGLARLCAADSNFAQWHLSRRQPTRRERWGWGRYLRQWDAQEKERES